MSSRAASRLSSSRVFAWPLRTLFASLPSAVLVRLGRFLRVCFFRAPACAFFTFRLPAWRCADLPSVSPPALLALHGAEELPLVHLRAALDAEILGLLVELVKGALARPVARSEPATPEGRDVLQRLTRCLAGLTGPRPLLVDRPRRNLLGPLLGATFL